MPDENKAATQDKIQRRFLERVDVNAWRSLFLVNELNELQSYKIISTNITLFVYALIMQGFGVRYWTNMDPDFVTEPNNSEEIG